MSCAACLETKTGREDPTPLPRLRPDLRILPGPPDFDGEPTFTIHDPLTGGFDKIDWSAAAVFERLREPTTMEALLQALRQETTLRLSRDEVADFVAQVRRRGFAVDSLHLDAETLRQTLAAPRPNVFGELFRKHLYWRIPLCNPDRFLEATLPAARLFGSATALWLYAVLLVCGGIYAAMRVETYLATFLYFFTPAGMAWFVLAIVAVKTVHELAHAYAAKARGCRVPAMGVAFILLWPVAWSDVTDAWKLQSRTDRLVISAAGLAAELAIAGVALVLWALFPPGPAKSVCFVVTSSSLLSTFFINMNPAMRYDGYYLLMDATGLDNLQGRAAAFLAWWRRTWCFGLRLPDPEPALSRSRRVFLLTYAVFAQLYRVLLYAAIALMIYHAVAKVLGVALLLAQAYWFFIKPILLEARAMWSLRKNMKAPWRPVFVATAVCAVVLWLAVPMPRRISLPAVVAPAVSQVVYTPVAGRVAEVRAEQGQRVQTGELLLRLEEPELAMRLEIAELELAMLRTERAQRLRTPESRDLAAQLKEEEEVLRAVINGLQAKRAQLEIRAGRDGLLYEWSRDVLPGMHLARDTRLGRVALGEDLKAYAFVKETDVDRIRQQGRGAFQSDATAALTPARVLSVNPVRAETIEFAGLTSAAQGALPVQQRGARLHVLESWYMIELTLETPPERMAFGETGIVWVTADASAPLLDGLRAMWSVVARESGF